MQPVIFIVDGSIALTGAFVCARNMARALEGKARVVLILPKNSTIPPERLTDFADVQYLQIRPLRRKISAVLLYMPALIISSLRLRWRLRKEKASILIMNDFYHMQGVVCRIMRFRGRIITWVRINPAAFGKIISGMWLRATARNTDVMVSVSEYISRLLPQDIRTELIYDGLDPVQSEAGPPEMPFRFVYVGNYIPGKGQDHAIESFAQIADRYPGVELHFHGSDMGLPGNRIWRGGLAARIAAHGLGGRIHLHGFSEDPAVVLQGALAALNFSTSESFSMTVLEAQGAGLPVIATRSGGPEEIIEDGLTGLLVPIGDIPAMAAAMDRLLLDPEGAAQMGCAARKRVAEVFSQTAFRARLLRLIRE